MVAAVVPNNFTIEILKGKTANFPATIKIMKKVTPPSQESFSTLASNFYEETVNSKNLSSYNIPTPWQPTKYSAIPAFELPTTVSTFNNLGTKQFRNHTTEDIRFKIRHFDR